MNRSNCTNLKQFEGGRVVKQGDSASLFGFALYDENWVLIDLDGQQAKIHFVSKKGKATFSATVQGSKVSFKIPKVLPVESYLVEVECDGYVFPSDQSVRVDVVQSAEEYTSEQVLDLVKNNVKEEIDKYISAHPNGLQAEEFPDLTVLYNLAKI
jgi:phage protein